MREFRSPALPGAYYASDPLDGAAAQNISDIITRRGAPQGGVVAPANGYQGPTDRYDPRYDPRLDPTYQPNNAGAIDDAEPRVGLGGMLRRLFGGD